MRGKPWRAGRTAAAKLGEARRALAVVVDPEAAAEVEGLELEAFGQKLARQGHERPRRLADRPQVEDLRADMALEPHHLDSGLRPRPPQDGGRRRDVDPELVLLESRRDVGMGASIDIRVHAQRDADGPAEARTDRGEAPDLVLALRVDVPDSGAHRLLQFRFALPHSREHDSLGRETGAQGGLKLQARDDVGPGAARRQEAQQRAARVGFQGIADPVRDPGEGLLVRREGLEHGGRAVEVERRAEARRGVLQEHPVPAQAFCGRFEAHAAPASLPARGPRSSRSIVATSPESPSTPTRFGKICKPFIRSPQAQTTSTLEVAPSTMRPQ